MHNLIDNEVTMKTDIEIKWLEPKTLIGQHAKLELLQFAHYDVLVGVVKDGQLWNL